MGYILLLLFIAVPLTAHASNIKETDLIASNVFFLPPSTAKTVFIQTRNSSDNQGVSLHDLGARLSAKGYEIVQDPSNAHYIVLANIVYCNVTKPEMPVETMVASGYGSGFGSSMMSGLNSLTGMASMAGPQGALAGAAASMGLGAIEGIAFIQFGHEDVVRHKIVQRIVEAYRLHAEESDSGHGRDRDR